jgi:RNA-splicing ligase RtcB
LGQETKQVKTGTNLFFGLSTKFWRTGKHVIIPGNVGTTPVQNIGAWNEIKDTFVSCEALTIINQKHS